MKNKIVLFASIFSRFAGLTAFLTMGLLFSGCTNSTTPTATTNCTTGTTVNIGSTTGGAFYVLIDGNNYVGFDNTSLNFSLDQYYNNLNTGQKGYNSNGTIMDIGTQNCPGFSYDSTTFSGASEVAYQQGHGYEGKFSNGTVVKFVAGAYNNGFVAVTYVVQ